MKPITREEQYLNKLTGEEQSISEPITREEQYLSRLCGADNIIPQTPETRREAYLAALCGEDVETPEPVTRIEQYMNFAAGKSQTKPEKAITREEMYWDKYQGGAVPEEKTVQGDIIHITDATGDNAVALSVALTPTQDGTPWISDTLNTEPYLSRAAQNGNTADETIVGGTIAWNQLEPLNASKYTRSSAVSGRLTISLTDRTYRVTSLYSGNTYKNYRIKALKPNNVYYFSGKLTGTAATARVKLSNNTASIASSARDALSVDLSESVVKTDSNENTYSLWINSESSENDYGEFTDLQVIDLTQMFGSTIADYVYSLEQAEAGAGVAWLKTHGFIDDNYHAYNEGELISAKPTAKVVGDTTYALGGADLRGLFKLDANNNLYCDGDVYTSDGTITRKYGIADLGTLDWNYNNSAFRTQANYIKPISSSAVAFNGICAKYQIVPSSTGNEDKTMQLTTGSVLRVYDFSYTDAATFKTAMSGVYLVYELTTPTTEQSTAYTNPQKAGEAEAFVDARTEKVPVGHSTRYSAEYDINGFEGVTVHVSETQTGGTTYPVTFTSQGTVYGGTIDVVSGEMSITYAIEDLGNLEWTYRLAPPYGYVFQAPFTSDYTATSYVTAYAKANPPAINNGEYHLEYSALNIRDPRTQDATEFTRLVTGQKIVYKLAEPITATIDPTEIALNEGENYVWTEEGTTTLTYMARAAQRVRSMNKALQTNLKSIELKKGGDLK